MTLKNIIKYPIFIFLVGCNTNKNTSSELEMKVINDVLPYVVKINNFYNEFEVFEIDYYLNHTDSISADSLRVLYNKEKDIFKEKTLLLPDFLVPMKKEYFDAYSKHLPNFYHEIYGKQSTSKDSIVELKSNKTFDIDKITKFGDYKILKESKNKDLEYNEGVTTLRFSRVYFYENNQKGLVVCEYYCWKNMCFGEDLYFVSLNSDGKWVVDKIHDLIVV
jgi:hypothetical protein